MMDGGEEGPPTKASVAKAMVSRGVYSWLSVPILQDDVESFLELRNGSEICLPYGGLAVEGLW